MPTRHACIISAANLAMYSWKPAIRKMIIMHTWKQYYYNNDNNNLIKVNFKESKSYIFSLTNKTKSISLPLSSKMLLELIWIS